MKSGHRRRNGVAAVIVLLGLAVVGFVIYTMALSRGDPGIGQQSSPHAIDQTN